MHLTTEGHTISIFLNLVPSLFPPRKVVKLVKLISEWLYPTSRKPAEGMGIFSRL